MPSTTALLEAFFPTLIFPIQGTPPNFDGRGQTFRFFFVLHVMPYPLRHPRVSPPIVFAALQMDSPPVPLFFPPIKAVSFSPFFIFPHSLLHVTLFLRFFLPLLGFTSARRHGTGPSRGIAPPSPPAIFCPTFVPVLLLRTLISRICAFAPRSPDLPLSCKTFQSCGALTRAPFPFCNPFPPYTSASSKFPTSVSSPV